MDRFGALKMSMPCLWRGRAKLLGARQTPRLPQCLWLWAGEARYAPKGTKPV